MNLFAAKSYFLYFFRARHRKGYGIHSPFLFDFITKGLQVKLPKQAFSKIEYLRKTLLRSNDTIEVIDLGAGSKKIKGQKQQISKIAKTSLTRKKYALLLVKLIRYFNTSSVLELGTSLGITTLFLASIDPIRVTTIEGIEEIANIAQANFEKLKAKNIHLLVSEFSKALNKLSNQKQKFDFVFIDGNHRYQATLDYFEKIKSLTHNDSILVFDDIHWSKGMENAWHEIIADKSVSLSLDIFQFGIVFFKKELSKQHFVLRY